MRTLVLGLMVATACGPAARHSGGAPDGGGDDVDADFTPTTDGGGCQKIDLLFVIDNSGSMEQEQTNLVANFPMFISVLDASGLDYRVGVTTTGRDYSWSMSTPLGNLPQSQDGGDNGTLLKPASCGMTKRWIDKGDPTPAQTFSCVAHVGTSGPSEEMPLGAIRDAFEDRINDGTNMGFRRADALLGIVVLTDENDCSYEQSVTLGLGTPLCTSSMEPVANYGSFLDTFTGNHTRWAAAVIAGKDPGSCSSSFGSAEEATRLKGLVQFAGSNGVVSSICDGDLSIGLTQALSLFHSACGGIIL